MNIQKHELSLGEYKLNLLYFFTTRFSYKIYIYKLVTTGHPD